MHIPDGLIGNNPFSQTISEEAQELLSANVTAGNPLFDPNYQLIIYAIIAIILIIFFFNRYRKNHTERDIPKIALFVVAVVIVQMIELPLPFAACVHISLITLLALYDLDASIVIYTFVTIIQAFLGEGGISTMGVNLLNLAIFGPLIAYTAYNLFDKVFSGEKAKNISIFLSAFITITLLGLIVSIEYAIAGTFPLTYGLTVLTPIEAVVGILEGIVTVFVMNALRKVQPELVPVLN